MGDRFSIAIVLHLRKLTCAYKIKILKTAFEMTKENIIALSRQLGKDAGRTPQ